MISVPFKYGTETSECFVLKIVPVRRRQKCVCVCTYLHKQCNILLFVLLRHTHHLRQAVTRSEEFYQRCVWYINVENEVAYTRGWLLRHRKGSVIYIYLKVHSFVTEMLMGICWHFLNPLNDYWKSYWIKFKIINFKMCETTWSSQ